MCDFVIRSTVLNLRTMRFHEFVSNSQHCIRLTALHPTSGCTTTSDACENMLHYMFPIHGNYNFRIRMHKQVPISRIEENASREIPYNIVDTIIVNNIGRIICYYLTSIKYLFVRINFSQFVCATQHSIQNDRMKCIDLHHQCAFVEYCRTKHLGTFGVCV